MPSSASATLYIYTLSLHDALPISLASVGFHDPDHHVLATALAADCLAEHAEGFAYARSIAEEKLENASRLLRGRGNFQPLFRLLWQRVIFSAANRKPALE